jgi:hypothetical protein
MDYNLAKESYRDTTVTVKIKNAIMRQLGAEVPSKSHLIRGRKYTLSELTDGFPDYLIAKAEEVVLGMTDEYILITLCENDKVLYMLNPNKNDDVKKVLCTAMTSIQPLEEMLPFGYAKVFETNGAKTMNGNATRYFYYRDSNDITHFYVLIQASVHERAEKKDLGSLLECNSIIATVWDAIDKKVKKAKFRKADLNMVIADFRIIENRQPLKAAIDVLEYLGYIRRTGKRRGRSEEYEKTGKQPPLSKLDEFL